MQRRNFLSSLGLGVGAFALLPSMPALAAAGDKTYARFAAARAASPWLAGFETVAEDALARSALKLRGKVPQTLCGTLFRNGPGRFDRGGQRYDHWFDGDGLVQAWRLGKSGVTHEARFVATHKYTQESRARQFLYHGAGTSIAGARDGRNADDSNTANTSVLPLGDRLFALWEGGSAWEIDPHTLRSVGAKTFRDDLAAIPFSAHPVRDVDGSVWNVGVMAYSGEGILVLWHLGADGSLLSATPIATGHRGYAHSFVISERHVIVVLSPWMFERDIDGAFLESLRWRGDQAGLALVIDKHDPGIVRRFDVPAGIVYHWGDAHETDGTIELSGCWYDDAAAANDGFTGVMRGERMNGVVRSELVHLCLPLTGGGEARLKRSGVHGLEFPDFDQRTSGPHRHLYALTQTGASVANYLNSVVALDRRRDRLQTFCYGEHVLVEEHRFVPRPGSHRDDDGWLVGTALDAAHGEHLLAVFDARHVEDGPMCEARLPRPMPLSFHAAFAPA
jgi:all-trans-8'-apo-beta-carotenal 15,15'-oxygenase